MTDNRHFNPWPTLNHLSPEAKRKRMARHQRHIRLLRWSNFKDAMWEVGKVGERNAANDQ